MQQSIAFSKHVSFMHNMEYIAQLLMQSNV